MQITIGGQPVVLRARTLRIDYRQGECSTASFAVRDDHAALEFQKGQTVEIRDEGDNLIFAGPIETAMFEHPAPGRREHRIHARCWTYLADKRIVAASWQDKKAGDIIKDIIEDYLAEEGVTEGTIEGGPEIAEALINYRPATEAFNRLAEMAGFMWFIDLDKQFHFVPRSEFDAPWTVTGQDMRQQRPQVEHSAPEYRNRQYIVGVSAVTDPQTEVSRGDGETKAFPLRYPIATVPTVEVSYNGGAWEEQTVGIRGVESGKQWYWNKGEPIISQDDSEAALTEDDLLRVTYRGQFNTVVISEDNAAIAQRQDIEGGSGIVEAVDRATQDTSTDAAFQLAASKLREYGKVGRVLGFRTLKPGLWPGMLLPVDAPGLGFNGEKLLIETVTAFDDGTHIWYDVKAVEGPRRRSWTAFFTALVDQAARLDRIAVGEDKTVTILVPLLGEWEWSEAQTVDAIACSVPDSTTYPSSSLYPC